MKITLSHGSGGKATSELIDKIFAKHFSNPVLNLMEDSAVVDGNKKIAITTDSFVVTPLFFKGGDIGRLAVCGTVNDLEVELLFCCVKVAHQVEHHLINFLRTTVWLVNLINHNDGLQTKLKGFLKDKTCLWHRPLKGINEKEASVGHVKHTLYLTTEI